MFDKVIMDCIEIDTDNDCPDTNRAWTVKNGFTLTSPKHGMNVDYITYSHDSTLVIQDIENESAITVKIDDINSLKCFRLTPLN